MRRLAALVLVAIAGLSAVPATACELIVCPTVGGQPSSILYYLIQNQPAPFDVRHEYIDTGTTAGIVFDDGTGPWKRVVHEFRSPVVRAVCQADRAQFEAQLGIVSGPRIQGELFQVRKSSNGNRVGTVFVDRGTAGVQATGGSISVDLTYDCGTGVQPEPVLQKVAFFHSAFDTAGIDGATAATIASQYISRARSRLLTRARNHMLAQGCTEIPYADFAALVQSGVACKLHYDNGDPGPGVHSQPAE